MEKLELKHLVGYLPYDLSIQHKYTKAKHIGETKLRLWQSKLQPLSLTDLFYKNGKSFDFHLLLHPLSDLTKEIEVNGEKFVPMDVLCSIEVSEEEDFKLYGKIPEVWKYLSETKTRYWDFWQVQKLYEWHFDVHGLIEKGLAIDINTL